MESPASTGHSKRGHSTRPRSILHLDMNAFYCSCHSAAEPDKYAHRPTAVAGSPETRHGVVVTASYEARKRGVRATMTVAEALKACPELVLIHPDFDLYRHYSRLVFDMAREYTPALEVFSIDECWMDITGSRQFGSPIEIAQKLQTRIWSEIGLPCSIGVGPNKFVAKMASDFKKPMGITVIMPEDIPILLWPLGVDQMFGIGEKTAERLNRIGLKTIGDLAGGRTDLLLRTFGKRGPELQMRANGLDDSPVTSNPEPIKSIGHSITLGADADDLDTLSTVLLNLSDQVGRRLRKHNMMAKTVSITIRHANMKTVTRARTLAKVTDLTEDIYHTAIRLLEDNRPQGFKVRLLGVTVSQLQPADDVEVSVQTSLFGGLFDDEKSTLVRADEERKAKLTKVTDALRDRYGEDTVIRARMLSPDDSRTIRNRRIRGTSLQKDNLH